MNNILGETRKTSPYINAGLGLKAVINDQWSLQADLRRTQGFLKRQDFGFSRSRNSYLTIGVNYAFGKLAQPAAVKPSAPEPVPEQTGAPQPRYEKITLSSSDLFAFDSAELSGQHAKLDEIANAMMMDTQLDHIAIIGYADRIGSERYNLKLSEKRANAVKEYLVSKGVSENRLRVEGRGAAEPVVTCDDKNRSDLIKCLAPNRRAIIEEITIERRLQ